MQAVDRLQFAPPSAPGLLRSISLAILAHALLLAALTWGVSWRRGDTITAEAELWAALPQEAAPPAPAPAPEPAPEPAPPPPPPKAAPLVSDAEIALAREREEKRKQEERLALEKLAARKKLEQEKLAAEDKKKKEKLRAQEEAKQLEKQRQENLKRMAGLAGTGAPSSTAAARQSAGPSASYAGRIRARIKPNIVFTEDVSGNPSAEVEVRTSPDGTIIGRRLLKSSKHKGWDEAVLKAIDKTEVLPRDLDGTMPPVLVITFRPRD